LTLALVLILPRPAHASPGDIDPTFGRHGVTLLTFGNAYAQGSAVAVDGQGRTVVAGTTGVSRDAASDIAVARLTPDGQLDKTFSGDGMATISPPGAPEVRGVAIDSAGRIVLSGSTGAGLLAIRLTADGQPDTTFSNDGVASLPVGGTASGGDLAMAGSGATFVGGSACGASGACQFAVAKFTPTGAPDVSFSGDGVVNTAFPAEYSAIRSIALAPDGSLVAAGGTGGGYNDTALVRYRPDGELEPTFGGGGRAIISEYTSGAQDIAIDPQGRILELTVTGRILRLLPDASIDGSWPITPFYGPNVRFAQDSAGRFVVAGVVGGCSRGCSPINTVVQRLNSDGSIDVAFGGRYGSYHDLGTQSDGARDVAVDANSRPIVAGFSGDRMVVARLEASSGPADVDGDVVVDEDDECALLYAGKSLKAHPGCPGVRPKLTLHRRKAADLWVGRATSPDQRCAAKQDIHIYRVHGNRREELGEATYNADGSFEADGNLTPGAYYAAVEREFKPNFGLCRAAHSKPVVIHD
jgi:uncharacterized delta-60 repeat protein